MLFVEKNSAVDFVSTNTSKNTTKKNESNCNICERKFSTAYILKKHIGNVHTIEKCNVCDKGMAKGMLARHMKTHIESKFECEKCENVYTRKDDLQIHQLNCCRDIVKIQKQPAVMIFNCETCEKTFTQKDTSHSTNELIEWTWGSLIANFVTRYTHPIRS